MYGPSASLVIFSHPQSYLVQLHASWEHPLFVSFLLLDCGLNPGAIYLGSVPTLSVSSSPISMAVNFLNTLHVIAQQSMVECEFLDSNITLPSHLFWLLITLMLLKSQNFSILKHIYVDENLLYVLWSPPELRFLEPNLPRFCLQWCKPTASCSFPLNHFHRYAIARRVGSSCIVSL